MKRSLILSLTIFLLASLAQAAVSFEIEAENGDSFTVTHHRGKGQELFLWFTHQDHHSKGYEDTVAGLQRLGKDVWQIDLLDAYFLESNSDNVRGLPPESVSIPLQYALSKGYGRITLLASESLTGTVLRGIHHWQEQNQPNKETRQRVAGSILFFPSFLAYTPAAGEAATYQNIIKSSNYPTFIFQPGRGKSLHHLPTVLNSLNAQSDHAFAWIRGDLLDWYFLYREDDELPSEAVALEIAQLPTRLISAAALLSQQETPKHPLPLLTQTEKKPSVRGFKKWSKTFHAPPLSLKDTHGETKTLKHWDNHVLLVNFWASWCGPCVEEIPSMNALRKQFLGQDFEIIAVNFRESNAEISKFTRKIPIDFPVLLDTHGETSTQWKVPAYPSSFLLDKKGNIRYSVNAGIDWNTSESVQVINALLEE